MTLTPKSYKINVSCLTIPQPFFCCDAAAIGLREELPLGTTQSLWDAQRDLGTTLTEVRDGVSSHSKIHPTLELL